MTLVMGRWEVERQRELFVATDRVAKAPRQVFYEKLNSLLREAGFDRWVEGLCEEFYSERGRGSIPPGRYFRRLFIGYFEGIDSQRGIAWRCDDRLSLKVFLGLEPFDEAPDHSRLTKIGDRLPTEVDREVFQFVLQMVQERGLLKGQTVGVDSTLLEANAAMKSIVRKDGGDVWEESLTKLAAAEGRELKSKAELIRFDKDRNKKAGGKKVSNDDWRSPSDPDACIAKMKDGTTQLAARSDQRHEALSTTNRRPQPRPDPVTTAGCRQTTGLRGVLFARPSPDEPSSRRSPTLVRTESPRGGTEFRQQLHRPATLAT